MVVDYFTMENVSAVDKNTTGVFENGLFLFPFQSLVVLCFKTGSTLCKRPVKLVTITIMQML